jgi:hypothetical protein
MNNLNNNRTIVPPFVKFGTFERNNVSNTVSEVEYFDYSSQKTIVPLFCGSDKKVTRSAKNVGSFFCPKWKNETDDAKEK